MPFSVFSHGSTSGDAYPNENAFAPKSFIVLSSYILCVFHPLRGLALKNIANGLLSIIS
jgi:hypothetical protein